MVWEQVTRRAGVSPDTYQLWIEERDSLNATAAAGHIVAVTRQAVERLPDSRLAAVLAHELGHHVGGHTWAGVIDDWCALPARVVGRGILLGLARLFGLRNPAGIACGRCLSVLLVLFLFTLTFAERHWWPALAIAVGPVLIAWLRRRAECRADAYAAGPGHIPDIRPFRTRARTRPHRGRAGRPPVAWLRRPRTPMPRPGCGI
ncbi:M48 family metalloprotease [Streptomyces sp. NPDC057743]|uniref:M48 family metalloprotease n=1 Tax=Streptomyces sp. NPDC057743 TaxID=3346236 RepID=UPI0036CBF80F